MTTAGNTADASGQGGVQIKFVTKLGIEQLDRQRLRVPTATTAQREHLVQQPRPAARSGDRQGAEGRTCGSTTSRASRRAGRSCKNKAFFFFNYEEQFRRPSNLTQNRIVLTPAAASGIFSYNAERRDAAGQPAAARRGQRSARPRWIRRSPRSLNDIRAAMATQGSLTDLSNPLVQQYNFQVPTNELQHVPGRSGSTTTRRRTIGITGSMNYRHINSTPDTTNNAQAQLSRASPPTGSQQSTRWTTSEVAALDASASNLVNEFRVGGTGGATLFSPEFTPDVFAQQGGYHLNFATRCCTGSNALHNLDSVHRHDRHLPGARGVHHGDRRHRHVDRRATTASPSDRTFTQGDLWLDNQTVVPTISFGLLTGDPAIQLFNATNFPDASTTDINNARGLYSLLTGHVNSVVGDARLTPSGDKYVLLGTRQGAGPAARVRLLRRRLVARALEPDDQRRPALRAADPVLPDEQPLHDRHRRTASGACLASTTSSSRAALAV